MSGAALRASGALKIVALIQARMGSKRLPGKSLYQIAGQSMIQHVVTRVSNVVGLTGACLVTSRNKHDDQLAAIFERPSSGICVYRGAEWDVLGRMDDAAQFMKADVVMRITGDCPLLASDVSSFVLKTYLDSECVYLSNVGRQARWPDGFDTEVMSAEVLHKAAQRATTRHDREHVTPWIRSHYKTSDVISEHDYGDLKLSVDRQEDLDRVRQVCGYLVRDDYSAHNVLEAVRLCGILKEI
jgi:spore coat polysaccharide biosynthesis protein SpsF (cytidylyltransferase family)